MNKKAFADQLAKEAEEATNKRDMGALPKINRQQCVTRLKRCVVVKDLGGAYFYSEQKEKSRLNLKYSLFDQSSTFLR